MGRKLVRLKNRKPPICERRRSTLRIQARTSDEGYIDQFGRIMVWSEKHRTYVPSRKVGTPPAINSPRP